MSASRRRWTVGNSTFTDDGDGVIREWNATTHDYIRTLPASAAPGGPPAAAAEKRPAPGHGSPGAGHPKPSH